jgi:nucleotide-binding universal stress UspA family protein
MRRDYLNILCPVDFSRHATIGIRYGAVLADHFKARLWVLTVADGEAGPIGELARLEAYVADNTRDFPALNPSPAALVREGAPGPTILAVAEEARAEVIVIPTHGAGDHSGPYGSTTLALLRHTTVPLLVISSRLQQAPATQVERLIDGGSAVLAPVDFHARAARDAQIAAGLAEAFGIPLVLLHVLRHGSRQGEAAAAARLRSLGAGLACHVPVEYVVAPGKPAPIITQAALTWRAALIVMGLHGDMASRGALPGSVALEVIARAPSLVIALPDAERGRAHAPYADPSHALVGNP